MEARKIWRSPVFKRRMRSTGTITRNPSRQRREGERGQATVEFALILPILVIVLFGTIEFGHAFWTYQQVSAAASEGARRAAVSRNSDSRDADIETAVTNASPNLTGALTVNSASTWAPGQPVTVTITYQLDSIGMGLLSTLGFDGTLTSQRTARVEQ